MQLTGQDSRYTQVKDLYTRHGDGEPDQISSGDSLYTDSRIHAYTARQAKGRTGARVRPSGETGLRRT